MRILILIYVSLPHTRLAAHTKYGKEKEKSCKEREEVVKKEKEEISQVTPNEQKTARLTRAVF